MLVRKDLPGFQLCAVGDPDFTVIGHGDEVVLAVNYAQPLLNGFDIDFTYTLADKGTGSIQLMTLLLSLAVIMHRVENEAYYPTVLIEEPEQNLYPESQKLVIMSLVRSLKKALENGSEQSMIVLTTHSPYVISVVNVLLAAAIVEEKGLEQNIISKDCILSSKDIIGYYIDEKGYFRNIIDSEIPMLSGNDLDGVSEWVDENISKLNEILFA